ncbi:MAG TPA: hypothetical protein VGL56_19820 [Fimbriimonadaceae bacterium]|jgi:hypothetical protein
MKRQFVALSLAAALCIGCSKKPVVSLLHSAPAPKLDPGWVTHDSAGFSIAAPSDWTLSLTKLTIGSIGLQNLDLSNTPSTSDSAPPTSRELPEQVDPSDADRQKKEGILLELYNKNVKPIPGEKMTRFYVTSKQSSASLDELAKAVKSEFLAQTITPTDLPIGKVDMITANNQTRGGDTITDIVYVVPNGETVYEVVFETTNHEGPIEQAAPEIMNTLRMKP